jgi:hypothetical protein
MREVANVSAGTGEVTDDGDKKQRRSSQQNRVAALRRYSAENMANAEAVAGSIPQEALKYPTRDIGTSHR